MHKEVEKYRGKLMVLRCVENLQQQWNRRLDEAESEYVLWSSWGWNSWHPDLPYYSSPLSSTQHSACPISGHHPQSPVTNSILNPILLVQQFRLPVFLPFSFTMGCSAGKEGKVRLCFITITNVTKV